MRVLVAGHLCIDFFPTLDRQPGLEQGALYPIGPLQIRCGGCVYTTGATLARLGVDVLLAASVGGDSLAPLLLELLGKEGLDTSRFTLTSASTSYSIVTQAPGRDRTFWHHPGANERFDGGDLTLEGVDLLHIGYPSLLTALCRGDGAALFALFRRARAGGCATSLDLAVVDTDDPGRVAHWTRILQRVLPDTDVLTPSLDDLRSALGWDLPSSTDGLLEAADRLLSWGAGVVLVTAGTAGLQVATAGPVRLAATGRLAPLLAGYEETRHRQPAVLVRQVAGTTGAGDVATAGFLAGLLRGVGPVGAARMAARVAARHVAGAPALDVVDDDNEEN